MPEAITKYAINSSLGKKDFVPLDILIKGTSEMPLLDLVELKEKFDESKLPYIVNFTDYNGLDEKFYNLIKNDLVPICTKAPKNDIK